MTAVLPGGHPGPVGHAQARLETWVPPVVNQTGVAEKASAGVDTAVAKTPPNRAAARPALVSEEKRRDRPRKPFMKTVPPVR